MKYTNIAVKYRPQEISEIIGHENIKKILSNIIKSKNIHHAYIFYGVRGTGKTSTARIFAKSINCQKGITINPCQKCNICIEITKSSSSDIIEIDGASNRGIEQIRRIIDFSKIVSNQARYKVFIIDEVHMLTEYAFNAMLKLIEEPPKNVIFILATTEIHKINKTIISRCQIYKFRPLSINEIGNSIKQIISDKNIKIYDSDKVIQRIYNKSEGSLRDAQNILEKIITYNSKTININIVNNILGYIDESIAYNLSGSILSNNNIEALKITNQINKLDHNIIIEYCCIILKIFKQSCIIQHIKDEQDIIFFFKDLDEYNKIKDISHNIHISKLLKYIEILYDTIEKLRKSNTTHIFDLCIFKILNTSLINTPDEALDALKVAISAESKKSNLKPYTKDLDIKKVRDDINSEIYKNPEDELNNKLKEDGIKNKNNIYLNRNNNNIQEPQKNNNINNNDDIVNYINGLIEKYNISCILNEEVISKYSDKVINGYSEKDIYNIFNNKSIKIYNKSNLIKNSDMR